MKISVKRKVTLQDVEQMHLKYPGQEIVIVLANTKDQSPEELDKIARKYPNVKFSVTGGLDPSKHKFNNSYYQARTYYSARELCEIVKIYSDIEKGIDPNWTETQKAMYIYKELCNRMEYENNEINGKNHSLGIGGLLYGKAVCSGFAMIYKEALDRVGIECHYQNKEGQHSWVVAKLDGEYRALELTWDVVNKGDRGCLFAFFNLDEDFYSDPSHNIKGETEEREFKIVPYTLEEIKENSKVINQKYVEKHEYVTTTSKYKETSVFEIYGEKCKARQYENGDIRVAVFNNKNITGKTFKRDDGSQFILIKGPVDSSGVHEYTVVMQFDEGVKIGKIYSEQDLLSLPNNYDDLIANELLSRKSLNNKIVNFKGYVGYIGKDNKVHYNEELEQKKFKVKRSK